ncbi:hypothetical protein CAI21_21325 [Alkalilimnicola ehrlichii]|uniref:hypothetical protein n=1 Tax=Alkalilimnicola ehrlichii TaxID=351052 RepID=UPI000E2F50F7|nr:hypothetical protein [Alkalilimnicola ehrlichii]RFA24534.1 hypothetical protein CAI21_21325 [Alkalilimnicola ehrlichii]
MGRRHADPEQGAPLRFRHHHCAPGTTAVVVVFRLDGDTPHEVDRLSLALDSAHGTQELFWQPHDAAAECVLEAAADCARQPRKFYFEVHLDGERGAASEPALLTEPERFDVSAYEFNPLLNVASTFEFMIYRLTDAEKLREEYLKGLEAQYAARLADLDRTDDLRDFNDDASWLSAGFGVGMAASSSRAVATVGRRELATDLAVKMNEQSGTEMAAAGARVRSRDALRTRLQAERAEIQAELHALRSGATERWLEEFAERRREPYLLLLQIGAVALNFETVWWESTRLYEDDAHFRSLQGDSVAVTYANEFQQFARAHGNADRLQAWNAVKAAGEHFENHKLDSLREAAATAIRRNLGAKEQHRLIVEYRTRYNLPAASPLIEVERVIVNIQGHPFGRTS